MAWFQERLNVAEGLGSSAGDLSDPATIPQGATMANCMALYEMLSLLMVLTEWNCLHHAQQHPSPIFFLPCNQHLHLAFVARRPVRPGAAICATQVEVKGDWTLNLSGKLKESLGAQRSGTDLSALEIIGSTAVRHEPECLPTHHALQQNCRQF
eukprot:1161432-Pelagomonas_calceolata.AAC.3